MSIDWNSEVNAVQTPIVKALRQALEQAQHEDWTDILILYHYPVDEHHARVGYISEDEITDERQMWLAQTFLHQKMHEDEDG